MATNWTDPTLTTSSTIRAIHIDELRSAIQDRSAHQGTDALPAEGEEHPPSADCQARALERNDRRGRQTPGPAAEGPGTGQA